MSCARASPPECRLYCASSPRPLEIPCVCSAPALRDCGGDGGAPGGPNQWLPEQVFRGRQAGGGAASRGEKAVARTARNSHLVQLEAARQPRDDPPPCCPQVASRPRSKLAPEACIEDGLADDNLQLTRVASGKDKDKDKTGEATVVSGRALPPLVLVEREVQIGMQWQVDTHVVREPPGSAVVLEVPLPPVSRLPPLTCGYKTVKAGQHGPDRDRKCWHSCRRGRSWTRGRQDPGSDGRSEAVGARSSTSSCQGIPVVWQQDSAGTRPPEWRPLAR